MPIEFLCSKCQTVMRTPEETAGKKGRCPQCGSIQQIPATSLLASPAAAAAPTAAAPAAAAPIEFPCPGCGQVVRVPAAAGGKKGKCPACAAVMQIPSASPASAPRAETIEFLCPGCRQVVRVSAAAAGKKGKCPQCSLVTDIPRASTPGLTPVEPALRVPISPTGLTPLNVPAGYPAPGVPGLVTGSGVGGGWQGAPAPLAPLDPLRGESLAAVGGYVPLGQRSGASEAFTPPSTVWTGGPSGHVLRKKSGRDKVRWLVMVPAILLLIHSACALVFVGIAGARAFTPAGMEAAREGLRKQNLPPDVLDNVLSVATLLVGIMVLVQAIVVLGSLVGSICMLRFSNWGLALTGAILAVIPACIPFPFCITAIPLGILSIIVLSLRDVRRAFN